MIMNTFPPPQPDCPRWKVRTRGALAQPLSPWSPCEPLAESGSTASCQLSCVRQCPLLPAEPREKHTDYQEMPAVEDWVGVLGKTSQASEPLRTRKKEPWKQEFNF